MDARTLWMLVLSTGLSGCGSCARADDTLEETTAAGQEATPDPKGSWQLSGETKLDAEVAPLPIRAGEEHRVVVNVSGVGEGGIKSVELKTGAEPWRRMLGRRDNVDGVALYQSRVVFATAGVHTLQLRVTKHGQATPELVDDWTIEAE